MIFGPAITSTLAFLVGVALCRGSTVFPLLPKGAIDWASMTASHNQFFLENMSVVLYKKYTTRAGIQYSMGSIMSRIDIDMARLSLDVEGSWFNFRRKITEILEGPRQEIKFLKILFAGGSVCSGTGCFPVERELMAIDNERYDAIVAWCSWTRRFVSYFQRILDLLTNSTTIISYRVCCSGGASTNAGLDLLKGRDYASSHCGNAIDYRWNSAERAKNKSDWEPDIVFWDYAVNDGNGAFFVTAHPRHQAYETFISRVINLPSKPQLVSLDFLHGYLEESNYLAQTERRNLNVKYCIPMVNYLSMFSRTNVHQTQPTMLTENSPWYAATFRNNHPGWPTHALWAKLVTLVLVDYLPVSGIVKVGFLGGESAIFDTAKNEFSTRESDNKCNTSVEADQFCSMGYTSRYDFTGGAADNITHLIVAQVNDQAVPVALKGSWKLRSDRSSDIDRSGWSFQHRKFNSTGYTDRIQESSDCTFSARHRLAFKSFNCFCHDPNFVVFRCNSPLRGAVKIGYLASYGPQWGSVFVAVMHSANNSSGAGKDKFDLRQRAGYADGERGTRGSNSSSLDIDSAMGGTTLFSEQSFVIKSRWQLKYSVLQEHRVIGPLKPFGMQHKLSHVDIAISMCSGGRFKLESISCC